MAITATSTVAMVREKFPQAVLDTGDFRGEQTIVLRTEHLLTVCAYLQSELRLKLRVGERREEHPAVPSVTSIWPTANWFEREVYDLFGITFTGHPNLQRILMPADWTTHPLRKDYPLAGFELPEPHWGGQVPYDIDPGVGSQTMRTPFSRELNESRSNISQNQEPGTEKQ